MSSQNKTPIFTETNMIFEYTRAQAIADGVLVDLSSTYASDTRLFKWPVACTAAIWSMIENAAEADHSEPGVYVWDICFMMYQTIQGMKSVGRDALFFKVMLPLLESGTERKLKMVCGPGDAGEPVLTVMLPEED